MGVPEPVVPDYGGQCLSTLVPALLGVADRSWLPDPIQSARQIVLLVLDGLGWEQLQHRRHLAPTLAAMSGGPITSVAPTTTSTALTSITTGTPPAEHGVLGYRIAVGDEVLNVLRWTTPSGDARQTIDPGQFVRRRPFGGRPVPVVTRAEFANTGFTMGHLVGTRLRGWRVTSTIPVEVAGALAAGDPFVYAYYDGVDKVAHEYGLGAHYDAELRAADALVADLLRALPAGGVLVVTADHGQVEVGDRCITIAPDVLADVTMLSGEGRFRWLHTAPEDREKVAARALDHYGDMAWVMTRDQVEAAGWFGGALTGDLAARIGDVALLPFTPHAFVDPHDTGELRLVSRHGSLTPAEAWVPLVAGTG